MLTRQMRAISPFRWSIPPGLTQPNLRPIVARTVCPTRGTDMIPFYNRERGRSTNGSFSFATLNIAFSRSGPAALAAL